MRTKIFIVSVLVGHIIFAPFAYAQSIPTINPWRYFGGGTAAIRLNTTSTQVIIGSGASTTVSKLETPSLTITGLSGSGTRCVQVDTNGVLALASAACGSGGSGTGSNWTTSTGVIYPTDSALNIGVGGTTPSSSDILLKIDGTAIFNQQGTQVVIKSSGKVGVGTATPSTSLDVSGDLRVSTSTQIFSVNQAGVGVGTIAPSSSLHIVGDLIINTSSTFRASTTHTALPVSHLVGTDANSALRGIFDGIGLSITGDSLNVGGLTVSEFLSANISQWTNDSGYITNYNQDFKWIPSGATLTVSSTYNRVDIFGLASSTELRSPSGTIGVLTIQTESRSPSSTITKLAVHGSTTLSGLGQGVVKSSSVGLLTTGVVSLTTEISGILPIANGGTATSGTATDNTLLIGDRTKYVRGTLPSCNYESQKLHYATGTRTFICQTDSGGGSATSPGGANTQVQYNNNNTFDGESTFTFTSSTGIVNVEGIVSSTQAIFGSSTMRASSTHQNLTASRLLYLTAAKVMDYVSSLSAWIAGTANQITVSDDGDGTITLSLPQNIHTGATPTFGGITVNGTTTLERAVINDKLRIPATSTPILNTGGDIAINTSSGTLQFFTTNGTSTLSATSSLSKIRLEGLTTANSAKLIPYAWANWSITEVSCIASSTGDTASFNVSIATSSIQSEKKNFVFSANQTCNSTTTPQRWSTADFASTSLNVGNILQLEIFSASTSNATFNIWGKQK